MRQSTKAPNIMAKNDVHLRQAFQLQILWNAFYNWSGTRHRYLKKFVTELPAVPVRGFQLSEHALSSSEKEVARRNRLLTKWMSWGWYTRRPLYSPFPHYSFRTERTSRSNRPTKREQWRCCMDTRWLDWFLDVFRTAPATSWWTMMEVSQSGRWGQRLKEPSG